MAKAADPSPPSRKRRPVRRFFRALVLWPVVLVLGFYVVCAGALLLMRFAPPPITSVQVQRHVEALFEEGDFEFRYDWVPLDRISDHAEHAVVAAEDTRFYEHDGIDFVELEKAREEARRRGTAPRGASTITQQLVKNLFLTTHRSYVRKALELPLALLADLILPKERILALYLNTIEWGPGVFGIEAAAQYHYGVAAADLSREQAARLAAVVPAPRSRRPQNMGSYAGVIQRRMWQMGW
ncbi:MAG: monofunctional biosynthetic peptidoglycan transglycosylase [Rhodothermales bacterium]|nr:monofunctional biosynthetic peptidoglycan transglycosylase [Rhodothermales bacterium]